MLVQEVRSLLRYEHLVDLVRRHCAHLHSGYPLGRSCYRWVRNSCEPLLNEAFGIPFPLRKGQNQLLNGTTFKKLCDQIHKELEVLDVTVSEDINEIAWVEA